MADFWCRQCWRPIGTPEMHREFFAKLDGDVPRDGHWPVQKNGTRCIMSPPSVHGNWLSIFVANLAVAAGLSSSFEFGTTYGFALCKVREIADVEVLDRQWKPGCGRPCPEQP